MGAIAWIFGLGLLAAAFPFLFHLIRRTPKGEVEFSSLMFLRPSPPTITRRSRLDNLLLLALRMAALGLIVAAFMRPFFNSNVKLDFSDVPGRKIAALVDVSASMKRGDLWADAAKKLKQVAEEADAGDQIAVFKFGAKLEQVVPLTKKSELGDLVQRFESNVSQPTWEVSDLGGALVDVANRLLDENRNDDQTESELGAAVKLQVVVVSDMQNGSSTSALQSFQWPDQVKVRFEPVGADKISNATLELMPPDESSLDDSGENVLVRSAKDSAEDQFGVTWEGSELPPVSFFVPPGGSKILRVARDPNFAPSARLMLNGDDAEFDNQFFALPPVRQTISIRYLGDEPADDPEGMLYYFQRALIETSTTSFDLQTSTSDKGADAALWDSPDFVVVTRAVDELEKTAIDKLLKAGVTLLVVPSDPQMIDSTRQWTAIVDVAEDKNSRQSDYAMLGEIDFSHPLFVPFSGSRFNDFTQVRFWEFLKPSLRDNVQVLARFDDDTPAIWHQMAQDKSDIFVMRCGWQPEQSQLALSSKFLPLMMRMIELSRKTKPIAASTRVGETVVAPAGYDRLVLPDGAVEFLEAAKAPALTMPGIHSFHSSGDPTLEEIKFAVNLSPSESQTDMMPVDQLSALGVATGTHLASEEEFEKRRQLLDFELENRQKIWKWLVLSAIALIIGESWLAGRTDRQSRIQPDSSQGETNE